MRHPFEYIPPAWRKNLFWPAFAASIIFLLIFNTTGAPLITPAAPTGIVSFELAGSLAQAQAMIDSWNAQARLIAAFGLGLDYLFMLAYSTAIGLGCLMASDALRRRNWPLARLGPWLAWGQWLAAVLDGIENVALISLLIAGVSGAWPEIAWWCAAGKFALIFLGLVYAFLGLVVHLAGRMAKEPL